MTEEEESEGDARWEAEAVFATGEGSRPLLTGDSWSVLLSPDVEVDSDVEVE